MTTRNEFLSTKFPILPYCELKRGPSTKWSESMHYKHLPREFNVNIFFDAEGTIDVSTFNGKETDPREQTQRVLSYSKRGIAEIIGNVVVPLLV